MADQTLPRFMKGQPLTAADLNRMVDALELALRWDVDGSSGLELDESAAGRVLRLAARRPATYAMAATTITAMSGTTFGVGTISLGYKDAAGEYQDYGHDPVDCYNSTTATVAVGSVIQAKWIDGDWAVDVVACSS